MMRAGSRVYDLIRDREGLRLKAYKRSGDVWTIGYGHTKGVVESDTCSSMRAEAMLMTDVYEAEIGVNAGLKGILNIRQGQYDALVDFVFNFGATKFGKSTLLWCVRNGQMERAANELLRWVLADGKVEPGLVIRRMREYDWFTESFSKMQLKAMAEGDHG